MCTYPLLAYEVSIFIRVTHCIRATKQMDWLNEAVYF